MEGITGAQWAALEPLVEACRPKGKTAPRDLRQTLSAIFRRHRQGATWRAIPAELGPRYGAAQLFLRWSKLGVWQRLLTAVQADAVSLGMVFLDGTTIRAHQKAAGARKRRPRPGSGTCAKRLAAAVAGMAPRLA